MDMHYKTASIIAWNFRAMQHRSVEHLSDFDRSLAADFVNMPVEEVDVQVASAIVVLGKNNHQVFSALGFSEEAWAGYQQFDRMQEEKMAKIRAAMKSADGCGTPGV